MAEGQPENNQNPNPAPPVTPPSTGPNQEVEALKKTIGEMQTTMDQMGEYIKNSATVFQTIAGDPNLVKQVQDRITNPSQTPSSPTQPQTPTPPAPDPTAQDVAATMRNNTIKQVEARFGLATMTPEKQKELKALVGDKVAAWGHDLRTIPSSQLESILTDAFTVASIPQAKEDGKLEALAEVHNNNMAAMPSLPTTAPQTDTTAVSPDQKKWAQKMDVNEDRVAANIKELAETGVISYKPKEQRTTQAPSASGTPTPPTT